MTAPLKIAITGTHSTGKSTFLDALETRLTGHGLTVGRIGELAVKARDLGFPILAGHTIESTLWIMAEGLRREAEMSLTCDVILVDRPILDPLGYLQAALEVSGRIVAAHRLDQLRAIARAHVGDYGLLLMTVLDPEIPLGEGRDGDLAYRQAVGRHIDALVTAFAPAAQRLSPTNAELLLQRAEALATAGRA